MGVGRNMIYRKSLYEKVGGFEKHKNLASGDDDLFVNVAVSEKNFSIILSPKTFLYSEPKTRWKSYFTQKNRHFTTATSYKLQSKIMLGGLSASHFFYFVTSVLALILKISTIFVLSFIVVRTVVIWFLYGKILLKFHDKPLIWRIPLLDTVYVLFYVVFTPALMIKTQKWN
jgi:poly-beta-1,6-N-acetyl-D-glucosamine synthase